MFFNSISTLEINSSYASHLKSIPLIITTPMSLGSHLMIIPCSFSSKPLIYFTCYVSYQTHHAPFRNSCQARTTLHYIHVSHHTIHAQTNINHSRMNEHPNSALPRPIPRSGWGISLRRDVLAQASLPFA